MFTNLHGRTGVAVLAGALVICGVMPAAAVQSAALSRGNAVAAKPSTYHAGYTSDTNQIEVARTGLFVVPEVTCDSPDDQFVRIGIIDEVAPMSIVQAGVSIGCFGGKPHYIVEVRVGRYGHGRFTSPGERLRFSVAVKPTGRIFAKVVSLTSGRIDERAKRGAPWPGAHFGTFSGDGFPVPNFGVIEMRRNSVNGVNVSGANSTRYNQVNGGELEIETGKAREGSFDLTFVSH